MIIVISPDEYVKQLMSFITPIQLIYWEQSPAVMLELSKKTHIELVLCDMRAPDMHLLNALNYLLFRRPDVPVIALVNLSQLKLVVQIMRWGVHDCIHPPFTVDVFLVSIQAVLRQTIKQPTSPTYERMSQENRNALLSLVGTSGFADFLRAHAVTVSKNIAPLLISGEVGTGKEFFAYLIHILTYGESESFLSVSSADFHENLFYTFTQQFSGTLFIEERDESAVNMCAWHNAIEQMQHIQGRVIISASSHNQDVYRAWAAEQGVAYISFIPLRERREDIPAFVKYIASHKKKTVSFTHEAMWRLINYYWPQNITELKTVVNRAISINTNVVNVSDIQFSPLSF